MIRFDNGPPDGDYVRYIDALMAERAAALVAATMSSGAGAENRETLDRQRAATDARKRPMTAPAFKAPHERSRDAKTGADFLAKPYPSSSNSSTLSTSTLSTAAATAIASAMMTHDNQLGAVPAVGTVVSAMGIAAGVILVLMGILGRSTNLLFIVAGVALLSWAIKRLGAKSEPSVAASPADVFATAATQRASSRIKVKG